MSLTAKRLRELLSYDPITGEFVWRVARKRGSRPFAKAGSPNGRGYIGIKVDGVLYKSHRLAWLYVHGEFPVHGIDHRDGNKSNNRIDNLRDVPQSINMRNRHRARSDSRTGVIGVHRKGDKFRAYIFVNKKTRSLGTFATIEEAAEARRLAIISGAYQ